MPQEADREVELRNVVQGKEGFKGKFWFSESDMKGGGQLKLDKSGKAIITVLRHLGRLSEVSPVHEEA